MGIPTLNATACIGKPVAIYALIDPRDRSVFYVGATTQRLCNRLSSHVVDSCKLMMAGPRYERIRQIRKSGHRCQIMPLETVEPLAWAEAEQFWIENLRFLGAILTNVAIGGPGALGTRQTKATQKLRREAAAGRDMSSLHASHVRAKARESNAHKVTIGGKTYAGIKVAAAALGVAYSTLHHRLDRGCGVRITPRDGVPRPLRGRPSGAAHPRARKVSIDGVEFATGRSAAQHFGVHPSVIIARIKAGRGHYL